MITIQEFDGLGVGDVIETVSIFPALTKDVVKLTVRQRTVSMAEFDVTFMGIRVGRWTCAKGAGRLSWGFQ